VGVPVIALMRQLSPEWVPLDAANSKVVMTRQREDWVKDIAIDDVLAVLPATVPRLNGTLRWEQV